MKQNKLSLSIKEIDKANQIENTISESKSLSSVLKWDSKQETATMYIGKVKALME